MFGMMSTTNDWFIIIKTETAFQNLSPGPDIVRLLSNHFLTQEKKTVEKTWYCQIVFLLI